MSRFSELMKKGTAVILTAAMMLTAVGAVNVAADDNTADVLPVALSEVDFDVNDVEVSEPSTMYTDVNGDIIETHINPMYDGMVLPAEVPEANVASLYDDPDTVVSDLDMASAMSYKEAVKYVRQKMIDRTTSVEFTCTDSFSISPFMADVFYDDGKQVPKAGDYLKQHYSSASSRKSRSSDIYTYRISISYHSNASQEKMVDAKVAEALASLNLANKTNLQKIKAIYGYITVNTRYDYSYSKYSAYYALCYRSAVCQGYSSLLYRMLRETGIPCRTITGTGRSQRHAWNIVKINGKWYNLDSTWEIAGKESVKYFLKSNSEFPNHTRDSQFTTSDFNNAYPMSSTSYDLTGVDTSGVNYVQSGWVSTSDGWKYNNNSGNPMTGWVQVGNNYYYMDPYTEVMVTNKWIGNYYLQGDGTMARSKWIGNYYVDDSGKWDPSKKKEGQVSAGWKKDSKGWWYQRANGSYPKDCWEKIDGKWYHFNGSGYMQTGWISDGGKWYYLNGSGDMATGWKKSGGKWYYLNGGGDMATGWKKIGNTWYYLHNDGHMAEDETIDGYYLDANGAMR